jgi:hypothetical protein
MTGELTTGRELWAERITAAWRATVESIFEVGRCLIEAKASPNLTRGEFAAMIDSDLPFTARTAQRLMAIARNPWLAKATHMSLLPPSWGTLYELSRLPSEVFSAKIEAGEIWPEMQRKDVARAGRREERLEEIARGNRDLPTGFRYPIIYADPPWAYGNTQPDYHTEQRDAYLVRGQELRVIRDGKLFSRRYNVSTFEEYCDQRWEMADQHANRLIAASDFALVCQNQLVPMPSRESHIRPLLTQLEFDDDRITVWTDVLATTNGAKIKAVDVDDAISRFIALRDKELAEWTQDFTNWWDLNVGVRQKAHSKVNADLRSPISMAEAETETQIKHQQVARR